MALSGVVFYEIDKRFKIFGMRECIRPTARTGAEMLKKCKVAPRVRHVLRQNDISYFFRIRARIAQQNTNQRFFRVWRFDFSRLHV